MREHAILFVQVYNFGRATFSSMGSAKYIFYTFALLSFFSCNQDNNRDNAISLSDLKGEWITYSAMKGSRPTKLLDSTYFRFAADTTLATNIVASGTPYEFVLSDYEIRLNKGIIKKYNVGLKTQDTLIITAQLRNIDFIFYTTRVNK